MKLPLKAVQGIGHGNTRYGVDGADGHEVLQEVLDKNTATLFAAAPELLEALYEARSVLEKKGFPYENEESWERIELAIAKAEGKE